MSTNCETKQSIQELHEKDDETAPLLLNARKTAAATSSTTNSESMRLLKAQHTNSTGTWNEWILRAWLAQITLGLLVLLIGMYQNGNESKYIPVKVPDFTCRQAFANVMSFSSEEPGAIQCCEAAAAAAATTDDDITKVAAGAAATTTKVVSSYQWSDPCGAPSTFPLAQRLTKCPEAWFIPLFPWLIRLVCETVVQGFHGLIFWQASQRLALYVTVMLIRGWVLYAGLNIVEAKVVTWEIVDDESCWYMPFLKEGTSSCYGRVFDFSDHIVFFHVQVLAIVWTEYLDSRARPNAMGNLEYVLHFAVLYLCCIAYMGAYKTARWFHTSGEIFSGWLLTLVITLPLAWLQSAMCYTPRAPLKSNQH